MAQQHFSNNAQTTLTTALTSAATSVVVSDGSIFSSPSGGAYELLTITDGTNIEIVKMTARSGNTLTVVREQESTTAPTSFAVGSSVSAYLTAGTLDRLSAWEALPDADDKVYAWRNNQIIDITDNLVGTPP